MHQNIRKKLIYQTPKQSQSLALTEKLRKDNSMVGR